MREKGCCNYAIAHSKGEIIDTSLLMLWIQLPFGTFAHRTLPSRVSEYRVAQFTAPEAFAFMVRCQLH
jgi:hypothetical protein